MQKNFLTYDELRKLEDELETLKIHDRKQNSAKIRAMHANGNASNNDQYAELKKEQRKIEARISEIEYILKNATIVDDYEYDGNLDEIILGCKVRVLDRDFDEEIVYSIVSGEDVNSLKNRISENSPMGRSLMGKRVGDIVKVQVGKYKSTYKILGIEGIEPGYIAEKKNKKSSKNENSQITIGQNVLIKDIQPKDFLTRVNVFKCTAENHRLIDIKCRVKVMLRNGKVEICVVPGAYCETCGKYFLLDADYKRLKLKGILICKVVENEFWLNGGKNNDFFNLNNESLLHMLGYNVNIQANLTKEQRWGILELVADEGILTVAEIRSHLLWLIKRNKNNKNFDDAILKWKVDSDHIADYKSANKITVNIASITSTRYKR